MAQAIVNMRILKQSDAEQLKRANSDVKKTAEREFR